MEKTLKFIYSIILIILISFMGCSLPSEGRLVPASGTRVKIVSGYYEGHEGYLTSSGTPLDDRFFVKIDGKEQEVLIKSTDFAIDHSVPQKIRIEPEKPRYPIR